MSLIGDTAAVDRLGNGGFSQNAGVTVVRALKPRNVGKSFDLIEGRLVKTSAGKLSHGVATQWAIEDTGSFVARLREATELENGVFIPAIWRGCRVAEFNFVAAAILARLLGVSEQSPELGGIHEIRGGYFGARLKRGLVPSPWVLLDADSPPEMPERFRSMNLRERLAAFEGITPSLASCERVEVCSSSARVHRRGEPPGGPTHAWVRLDDPSKIDLLRGALDVMSVNLGLSFPVTRYSRATGEPLAQQVHRTLFDLSTIAVGRIVFCSRPTLSQAAATAGYCVSDARVEIVNPGGGPLSVSELEIPGARQVTRRRNITGENVSYDHSRGITRRDGLTYDTPVEARGVVRPLREWIEHMERNGIDHFRCEAPFRESQSEAAFIGRTARGHYFIFDSGLNTSFFISDGELMAEATRNTCALASLSDAPAGSDGPQADLVGAPPAQNEADDGDEDAARDWPKSWSRAPISYRPGEAHLTAQAVRRVLFRVPRVYRAISGELVRVDEAREFVLLDRHGQPRTQTGLGSMLVTRPWLSERLLERLKFLTRTADGRIKSIGVPQDVLSFVMDTPGRSVPLLRGLIGTPTMLLGGRLVKKRGYNRASGFWLNCDFDVEVPERPTAEDVRLAYGLLLGLLEDFPFDSAVHRSAALAMMISGVLRPAFPSCPGFVITAAMANSGKSYLARLYGALTQGRPLVAASWRDQQENDKQLVALLLGGSPVLYYDNANRADIGGDILCSVLTEPFYKMRLLGVSKEVEISTAALVCIVTGIHTRVAADASRRFLKIYLRRDDADTVRSGFRSNPEQDVLDSRGRYVSAILTLARAFLEVPAASRPCESMQSFEAWAALVPSLLTWLGEPSPVATMDELVAEDEAANADAIMLALAHKHMGDDRFKTGEFVVRLQASSQDYFQVVAHLGLRFGPGLTNAAVARELGRYFGHTLRDAIHTIEGQPLTLRRTGGGTHGNPSVWRVCPPPPRDPIGGAG